MDSLSTTTQDNTAVVDQKERKETSMGEQCVIDLEQPSLKRLKKVHCIFSSQIIARNHNSVQGPDVSLLDHTTTCKDFSFYEKDGKWIVGAVKGTCVICGWKGVDIPAHNGTHLSTNRS